MTGADLTLLAIAAPLVVAALAALGGRWVWPLYALAALPLAGAGALPGGEVALPGLLLGMTLAADPTLAPALIGAGAVWAAAALHARGSMAEDDRARVFACLFGLAMAGNALLLLAEDMVSFYVGYSVMSLSAWGLVAHKRDLASDFAARVYLVFAVAGELCLFAAVMLIDAGQGNWLTPRVLGLAPPEAAVWLALTAFAIKAGLVPLHMWLPLAHPAAPVPASAALSGAMLKAGLVGAAKLAPPELVAAVPGADPVGLPGVGPLVLALGLAGAFAAGLYAALTAERKTALAYSSVSQLSLAFALLGAAYAGIADPAAAVAALALFALHHGLAKGALFLGVDSGLPRPLAILASLLPALALTGLPFTLGDASKQAFEAALLADPAVAAWMPEGAPDLGAIFGLAAFATALAMARAMSLPWAEAPRPDLWKAAGVLALSLGCVVAALPMLPDPALPAPDGLAKALGPSLVLLLCTVLLARMPGLRPRAPAGDLLRLVVGPPGAARPAR